MNPSVSQNAFVIGVDVGGTKVAAGLVDYKGAIQSHVKGPMVANAGAAAGLEAVKTVIDQVSSATHAHDSIRAIGICSPGPLDPAKGIVINPPNLPCWRNFPLASEISRIYGVPVKVDNDANAAALAETLWGAGREYRNVFYTCMGTGIGTGIVFDGCIYHGRTGAAGEGGHMSIDYRGPRCGCGKLGCIEALASGLAIARRAREALSKPEEHSTMLELAGGSLENINSHIVGRAHAAGDPIATRILQETVDVLTVWLGNIVDLLEPDVIIMGGGVASMLQPFFSSIQEKLPQHCINSRCQEIPIVSAFYGEDSGIAGGAALSSQRLAASLRM
ncbi:MAG TPA: ROK family protein [Terriglobales bacterium]|nr:ROK family protein [Terriglobales bacterium]